MNSAEMLRTIVLGKNLKLNTFYAKVNKVKERTCDVEILLTGAKLTDVNLNTIGENIVIKPKKDSTVIVCKISESDYFVAHYSEIEKIILKTKDNLEIECEGKIIFNKGENTTAKADLLKSELEKMSGRIDQIISCLSTGSNSGGAVGFTGLTTITAMQKEDFSNIENNKIKH